MNYFPGTIGQAKLKQEIYDEYGPTEIQKPLAHGLLISRGGMGKSRHFLPGIARMTGFEILTPVIECSTKMKLDAKLTKTMHEFEKMRSQGRKVILVFEELESLGKVNSDRLRMLLSEGSFAFPDGETWQLGPPGEDWFVVGATNDTTKLSDPFLGRFVMLPLDRYTKQDLVEIGWFHLSADLRAVLDKRELFTVAGICDGNPRAMKQKVSRMEKLWSRGQPYDAAAVIESFRLDKDGLNTDQQQTLMTIDELGGRTSLGRLRAQMGRQTDTVANWMRVLIQRGYVYPPRSGAGGGHVLTPKGIAKAAELQKIWGEPTTLSG